MRLKPFAVSLLCLLCAGLFVNSAWSQVRRPLDNRIQNQPGARNQPQNTIPGTRGNQVPQSIKPGATSAQPGTNYAILIGINKYPQIEAKKDDDIKSIPLSELLYCEADMKGLKGALIKSKYITNEKNIKLLVQSEDTTRKNILEVLEGYKLKLKRNDRILVAFAGHGISLAPRNNPAMKDDYFCCSDARIRYSRNFDEFRNEGLIPLGKMNDIFETYQCDTKIFFTDACRQFIDEQSVASTRGSSEESNLEKDTVDSSQIRGKPENMSENPGNIQGLIRIASCKKYEVSHELPLQQHGAFTNFLIKGLEGAADNIANNVGNGDGKITLRELYDYASTMTTVTVSSTFSSDTYNAEQTPIVAFPELTKSCMDAYEKNAFGICTPTARNTNTPTGNGGTNTPNGGINTGNGGNNRNKSAKFGS